MFRLLALTLIFSSTHAFAYTQMACEDSSNAQGGQGTRKTAEDKLNKRMKDQNIRGISISISAVPGFANRGTEYLACVMYEI